MVGNEPFLEPESLGTIVWIANTTANMAEKRWENCEFLNQYPKGVHDLLGKVVHTNMNINSYMFEILTAAVFLQFKNTFSCLNLRLKTESLQLNLGMIHFVHW